MIIPETKPVDWSKFQIPTRNAKRIYRAWWRSRAVNIAEAIARRPLTRRSTHGQHNALALRRHEPGHAYDVFAGVAMQASAAGETQPIRVATTGVFEFDCLSATHEVGDLMSSDENGGGTALLNQTVVKVLSANAAIGRCAKRANPAATRVLVDIVSSVMKGGTQVIL